MSSRGAIGNDPEKMRRREWSASLGMAAGVSARRGLSALSALSGLSRLYLGLTACLSDQ